jgi:phage terminase large subunit-like protein
MTDLAVELLPWQQEVFEDPTRFKIIAAGRRCGKSRCAAWKLILEALGSDKGQVFYVAPTQGQARDIMWDVLIELAHPVIKTTHVNNMQITLINGAKISLKGGDRPETMRGVSLKYLVIDEYADVKPEVWEQILRPALADLKGEAMFIGTPMGRNHFYELFKYAEISEDPDWKGWHFTSYDNPTLDPNEIKAAERSMSTYSFRQEFLASFEAMESEIFKEDWLVFDNEEPKDADFYISVDLAGFSEEGKNKTKNAKLDETAISIVKVGQDGWWVKQIVHGRWGVEETARKIFEAVTQNRPLSVGIEKGALKNAVLPYLTDLMRSNSVYFNIVDLNHGNQKKTDRVVWSLQGRMEHGKIKLNKGEWNSRFLDQLFQFPSKLVHDDLVDSLAYIDQLAQVNYFSASDMQDDYEPLDALAGF